MPFNENENGNSMSMNYRGQQNNITEAALTNALTKALKDSLQTPLQSMTAELRELKKSFNSFDKYTRDQDRREARQNSSSSPRYRGYQSADLENIKDFTDGVGQLNRILKTNKDRLDKEMHEISSQVSDKFLRRNPLAGVSEEIANRMKSANDNYVQEMESIIKRMQEESGNIDELARKTREAGEVYQRAQDAQIAQETKILQIKEQIAQKEEERKNKIDQLTNSSIILTQETITNATKEIDDSIAALNDQLKEAENNLEPLANTADAAAESLNSLSEQSQEARNALEAETTKRAEAAELTLAATKETLEKQKRLVEEGYSDTMSLFGSIADAGNSYMKRLVERASGSDLTESEKERAAITSALKALDIQTEGHKARKASLEAQLESETDDEKKEEIKALIHTISVLIKNNETARKEILKASTLLGKSQAALASSMKDVGKALTDNLKSFLNNFVTKHMKYYENYYRENLEGFKTMYSSMEKTMSEVANRLKLDQGGFSNLEETINRSLAVSGMQGSMSAADVNEFIIGLANAGITSTDEAAALAVQQATLAKSGSTLDLTNEGVLREIRLQARDAVASGEFQSFDEALSSIVNSFMGFEKYMTDAGENITSLAGGNAARVYESIAKLTTDAGGSIADFNKNLATALSGAQQLENMGVDAMHFLTEIENITSGKITDQSAINQVAFTAGLTPDVMMSKIRSGDIGYILEQYANTERSLLGLSGGNETIRPYVAAELGASMPASEYRRLVGRGEGLELNPSNEFYDKIQDSTEEVLTDLHIGSYLTATEQRQVETQNAAFAEALEYQKIYRGDEKYLATQESIYDAVTNILYSVKDIAVGLLTSRIGFGGMFGGGGSAAGGGYTVNGKAWTPSGQTTPWTIGRWGSDTHSTLGNFATGARGTTAGMIGRIGGAGYGLFEVGSSISENVTYDENGNIQFGKTVMNTLSDEDTWRGIGMTAGSAVGGPIAGYFIGELMAGGSKIGKWLVDTANPVLDESDYISEKYAEAANKQLEAAQQQYDAAQSQINAASKFTDIEKVNKLLEVGAVDESGTAYKLEDLMSMSSEALNEVFQKSYVNPAYGRMSEAQKAVSLAQLKSSISSGIGNIGKSGILHDIQENANVYSELASHGRTVGEEQLASELGGGSLYNIYAYIKDAYGSDYDTAISEIFGSDIAENENSVRTLKSMFATLDERKNKYDNANNIFKTRWEQASSASGVDPSNYSAVLKQYYSMYGNSITKGMLTENQIAKYWDAETNSPNLPNADGQYWEDAYVGKYKSGLTNVPNNNYPAILHEGERVLTKEEAVAYNKLSSSTISSLSDIMNDESISNAIMSNVDNSLTNSETIKTIMENHYASMDDSIPKSIDDHTQTIEETLKQILNTLYSLISTSVSSGSIQPSTNNNVLMMDSNQYRAIKNARSF